MIFDQVRKIYFEQIQNRADEEGIFNKAVQETEYYKELFKIKPTRSLKNKFDDYRRRSAKFTNKDYSNLNLEIRRDGTELREGCLLFHGRSKEITLTDKPISCSTHPALAVWHARKHRNHESNGKPIYIYIIKVTESLGIKSCVDFQDSIFGHENEVLLQADVQLNEICRTEISGKVFVIEINI